MKTFHFQITDPNATSTPKQWRAEIEAETAGEAREILDEDLHRYGSSPETDVHYLFSEP